MHHCYRATAGAACPYRFAHVCQLRRLTSQAIPAGTEISSERVMYDYSTNPTTITRQVYNFTVAATTYQITVEKNRAEMLAKDIAQREADPDCAPCAQTCEDGTSTCCSYPQKCWRTNCVAIDGIGCASTAFAGGTCDECHTYYPEYMSEYQQLRLPTAGDSSKGEIVAEVLSEVKREGEQDANGNYVTETITYLIQCVTTSGDAMSKDSIFTPQDSGTLPACGLTASTSDPVWLRGPDNYDGQDSNDNALLGKIVSIDRPVGLLVKSSSLLPQYESLSITSGVIGWNGTASVTPQHVNQYGQPLLTIYSKRWASFPGKVLTQPDGTARANYTIKEAVRPDEAIHGLKCLHNCIDPDKMGTSANPPANNSVIYSYAEEYGNCVDSQYTDCSRPDPYTQTKVPLNHTFKEYSWQGTGLMACSKAGRRLTSSFEEGSGDTGSDSLYSPDECTESVAVPAGTACSLGCYDYGDGQQSCWCDNWRVTSTLFQSNTAADFKCPAVAGQNSAEGTTPEACLTYDNNGRQVANIDDLDEYFEYHTGVPAEWGNQDTVWLEAVASSAVLQPEPPLQLTVQVPCTDAPNSISGIDYACKKLVLEFSDGIDLHNSRGFPMWCLNRQTGAHRAPLMGAHGHQECHDYNSIDWNTFDWERDHFELYPDINPDIDWEANDGKMLKWGIKPAEKTIVYTLIDDGNCTQSFTNPLELDESHVVVEKVEPLVSDMRTKLAPLLRWYDENKASSDVLRVHTGAIVGNASIAEARRLRRKRRLAARRRDL